MINELSVLSEAMRAAEISTETPHTRYQAIPNITKNAPCFRIVLDGSTVALIEGVAQENNQTIRKYGDKQGSFPAMNLVPLYSLAEENRKIADEQKKEIDYIERCISGKTAELDLPRISRLCQKDNWGKNFLDKYRRSVIARPNELKELLREDAAFEPALSLIQAMKPFEDPQILRQSLEKACFQMLQDRKDVALALRMLFFAGSGSGNLSVVFDTFDLEDEGFSTIGGRFTNGLNKALWIADREKRRNEAASEIDAFGIPFAPPNEPMPTVKLPAGWDAALRTMFDGQPSQFRYRRINDGSYPISPEKRRELKAALEWVSDLEKKNTTWISTGKGEALFVYPSRLRDQSGSFTAIYKGSDKQSLFATEAKRFIEHISKLKRRDPEYYPDRIQLFYLRKLDQGRSKLVYTHSTKPEEILDCCDSWRAGAEELPVFHFGQPDIPFPLDIAPILNCVWKLDGNLASSKFRAVQTYHGLELFFNHDEKAVGHDLQVLARNSENLAVYAGRALCASGKGMEPDTLLRLKATLALMGMLLHWTSSGKDTYMNEFPYWFGQLLKASDSLHELYCAVVRESIPPQLVGGSMFAAAAEYPLRSFSLLGQRMMPYLNWARTHQNVRLPKDKNNPESKEGPSAGYYLKINKQIGDKLRSTLENSPLTEQTRFTDAEKAQLFIGYLASFPKSEKPDNSTPEKGEEENA